MSVRTIGTVRAHPDEPIHHVHAGTVPYTVAWGWQRELQARRADRRGPDVLLTLEHPPVYTAGSRARDEHLRWDAPTRAAHGIELYRVDRGGDVTYHGPGQLVAYPILALSDLRRVVDYVRALEEVCIRVAGRFGVAAHRDPDHPGVWVGRDKLVAIGVRVGRGGVTMHGLAFNVAPDLGHFAGIVPCGIPDRGVCSLASLGVSATVVEVDRVLAEEFAAVFGCQLQPTTLATLGLAAEVGV